MFHDLVAILGGLGSVAVVFKGGGYLGAVGLFDYDGGYVDGIGFDLLGGGEGEEGQEEEGQGEEDLFHIDLVVGFQRQRVCGCSLRSEHNSLLLGRDG